MVPFFEQPVAHFGEITISAWGALVFAGCFLALGIVHWRAARHGFAPERAARLFILIFGVSAIGSHLVEVLAYNPGQFARDPWSLLRVSEGQSSFGGAVTGIVTLFLVARWNRWSGLETLRFIDLMTWCFLGLFVVARLGCALAHDHLGPPSNAWLAVAFPDGPRLDLGLLEWLALLPMAGLFLWLGRRERPAGLYTAVFMVLYGSLRLLLDFWRIDDARYWGLTPGQYGALLLVIIGAAIALRLWRKARPIHVSPSTLPLIPATGTRNRK